ncbi:uncharacterized protein LOC113563854 [Drosophila erecta]|uniref:uncharacterized protein LOC113563854 n=1 Tax=Drosophila erecta TaxID=7220 RepID=UPI000F0551FC|nr:uncharacterized protein LOC113563854 [Drosophila erecta]
MWSCPQNKLPHEIQQTVSNFLVNSSRIFPNKGLITSRSPSLFGDHLRGAVYSTDDKWILADRTKDLLVSNATVSRQWIRSYDGFREKNEVSVGTNVANGLVFVCRIRCAEGVCIGTLYPKNPSKKRCILKYDNLQLRASDEYEILVRQRQVAPFMAFAL